MTGRDRNDVREAVIKAIITYQIKNRGGPGRIDLEGAGIPAVIVGVGIAMEGEFAGARLLVLDGCAEAALKVLEDN